MMGGSGIRSGIGFNGPGSATGSSAGIASASIGHGHSAPSSSDLTAKMLITAKLLRDRLREGHGMARCSLGMLQQHVHHCTDIDDDQKDVLRGCFRSQPRQKVKVDMRAEHVSVEFSPEEALQDYNELMDHAVSIIDWSGKDEALLSLMTSVKNLVASVVSAYNMKTGACTWINELPSSYDPSLLSPEERDGRILMAATRLKRQQIASGGQGIKFATTLLYLHVLYNEELDGAAKAEIFDMIVPVPIACRVVGDVSLVTPEAIQSYAKLMAQGIRSLDWTGKEALLQTLLDTETLVIAVARARFFAGGVDMRVLGRGALYVSRLATMASTHPEEHKLKPKQKLEDDDSGSEYHSSLSEEDEFVSPVDLESGEKPGLLAGLETLQQRIDRALKGPLRVQKQISA